MAATMLCPLQKQGKFMEAVAILVHTYIIYIYNYIYNYTHNYENMSILYTVYIYILHHAGT